MGYNFAVNGVPVGGLGSAGDRIAINLQQGDTLTAILADGPAFGHSQGVGFSTDSIESDVLTLVKADEPVFTGPNQVLVNFDSELMGAAPGQFIEVVENGRLHEQFRIAPGGRVEVNGGRIDDALHVVGGELVINAGSVGRRLKAFDQAVITITGGSFTGDANFYRGSTLNVEGGNLGADFRIEDGAEMNVSGGEVFESEINQGGVLNLTGGEVAKVSGYGGVARVSGGTLVDRVDVTDTGVIDFSGGRHTDNISVRAGGQMVVRASEVHINGAPAQGLGQPGNSIMVNLSDGTVLSGVYPDGTPFVFSGDQEDVESAIQVIETTLSSATPTVFMIPGDPVPPGVRAGQTLILNDGGELPINFTAGHGSTVEIHGGTVGFNFEAVGAMVDITGGQLSTIDAFAGTLIDIGGDANYAGLEVFDGAVANISGGTYSGGNFFRAHSGSTLNIQDGLFNGIFHAEGAEVHISGGTIGDRRLESIAASSSRVTVSGGFIDGLQVSGGSQVEVTGGTITHLLLSGGAHAVLDGGKVEWLAVDHDAIAEVLSGNLGDTDNFNGTTRIRGGALGDSHEWLNGRVELHGYDFQVDGVPVSGLADVGDSVALNYAGGTTLSGIFSDGTPFNIVPNDNFQSVFIKNGVLRLVRTDVPSLPDTVVVPNDPAPYGAAAGQTVIVNEGGALDDNFVAGRDSIVEIRGGSVGNNFEAERSHVTIAGGVVGERMDVFNGASVIVTGGSIGEELEIHPGGVLSLQGGEIARSGRALGGTLNMSGGSLGEFQALAGSLVDVSGGNVEDQFVIGDLATANITGGNFQSRLRADTGSTVHITGGSLRFDAQSGSSVSIDGGIIKLGSIARAGSNVIVTGGTFGDAFDNFAADSFVMHGVNFEIDGVAVAGLTNAGDERTISVTNGQLFTGTLADGTPFALSTSESDDLNTLRLVRSADLPPGPTVIQVPNDAAPLGVRAGQELTLLEGGHLHDSFNAGRGSVVNVLGGTVGNNFEAFAAVINIEGGQLANDFDAFAHSEINIRGGSVGQSFEAHSGSVVNITGGSIAGLDALNGATINLGGGAVSSFQATTGSHSIWRGGSVGSLSVSGAGTTLAMHGADFELNGVPIAALEHEGDSIQFDLPTASLFTAVLADGTPVALGTGNIPFGNAQIANGTLTLVRSAEPGMLGPSFQHVVDETAPFAIGAGQTLLVDDQGQLPNNFVAGKESTLHVNDGSIGGGFRALGADIQIAGGKVDPGFTALGGTDLVITGGEFSNFFLYANTHTQIHGGQLPNSFLIDAGAVVDIYGTSFLLNNAPIPGLEQVGSSIVLTERSFQQLTALLLDGSQLEWTLGLRGGARDPIRGISNHATLRLHFVPEPGAVVLAFFAAVGLVSSHRRSCRSWQSVSRATLAGCPSVALLSFVVRFRPYLLLKMLLSSI